MKKLILISLVVVLSLGFNSCGKDSTNGGDGIVVVYKVPVDIAARYIAMAFCSASGGINSHMENATAAIAHGRGSFDSTFTIIKKDSSAAVKYQYQVEYTMARITSTPPKVTFDYSATGGFNCSSMVSDDEQNGTSWFFTTLDQSQFTLNGSGTDGGQQYAPLEKVQFTSRIIYSLTNVMMDKMTFMAVSGTSQISITGAGPAGVAFSYSGTLTFNGDRKAELVLNGSPFSFSLTSGSITK
jgi:hypothetical protein